MQVENPTLELISIGNELLLGNTINTNASWIAARATEEGACVTRITTVRDHLPEITNVVRESIRRKPNYIITTGGIGPTFDDMTTKAVARAIRRRMRIDPTALAMIKEHYSSRFKRPIKLTKARLKMATLPLGGTALANPVGTAPAITIRVGQTCLFCLPGVPREARAIFTRSIVARIQQENMRLKFIERWIKVIGVMESTLAPLIDQAMHRWPDVYIKSHPRSFEGHGRNIPHIELHLSRFSSDSEQAKSEIASVIEFMKAKLRLLNARIIMRS